MCLPVRPTDGGLYAISMPASGKGVASYADLSHSKVAAATSIFVNINVQTMAVYLTMRSEWMTSLGKLSKPVFSTTASSSTMSATDAARLAQDALPDSDSGAEP